MRTILAVGALALFGLVQPRPRRCAARPAASPSLYPSAAGGMMCGGMGAAAQDDPMADKPAQKPQAVRHVPLLRNMAMMRGGIGRRNAA